MNPLPIRNAARTPTALALAVLAAHCLPAPLPAQAAPAAPASQDLSMRLHAAWLREMLDLDVRGAVTDYQAIARDRQSRHVRWIAVARLGELQRLGVPVGDLGPVRDAPPAIQEALARLEPPLPPAAELLARAGAPVDPQATGEPASPIALRPAVPVAQQWARSQLGPSANERQRQRMAARARGNGPRPGATTRPDPAREQERTEANHVLQTELEGRADQAANLRALYNPDWKPLPIQGTAAELDRVRAALDKWLEEQNLGRGQQELLQRLREELRTLGAGEPSAALQFVARLPYYGERLLAEAAEPKPADGRPAVR